MKEDMFRKPRYFMPNNMYPSCQKHIGGGNYMSDLCVCFLSDGTYELCNLLESDSGLKWNCSEGKSVQAWLEV